MNEQRSDKPRIAVVTGASRGAGKGIALALGATGATVYVTGRSAAEGDAKLPGTVFAAAEAVTAAGGLGIPVLCDHGDDAQVAALFERVRHEQGRLDILVNNACSIPDELTRSGPFWEKPLHMLDLLKVGMRSHYVASWHAAPIMLAQRSGLIVHTSSYGSVCYMHGPAYGAGKAAVDKMAHDMAVDLRSHNVAVVSLWMGLLRTERTEWALTDPELARKYEPSLARMQSPQFPGRVIDALSRAPDRMARSGKVWIDAELAVEYGVTDIDGRQPPSYRRMLGAPPVYSDVIVD
ncbi:SDR family NAD(P)-dependent oxidoreductase [Aromatoleum anaerobium]|uniref:SDR family NAD(P)-dependent oxidoreductase n=1 Tax=Aromatoleum anaerobium TaxID=182180 RepID=A0ABX1PP68_9RHOO|nr:SDR family NAD(P)-dependent oxidoreductase [Aromatoleum anaerobium]MCK0508040.1 SDR family NAD(P)-dependent oxidoreductase [Aromatoleum anaerobium]